MADMIRLKSGEVVKQIGSYVLNGVTCLDLKVVEVGDNRAVSVGQEFMLMEPELKRNLA
jgi:alanine racemase